jgi:hypothetical protein
VANKNATNGISPLHVLVQSSISPKHHNSTDLFYEIRDYMRECARPGEKQHHMSKKKLCPPALVMHVCGIHLF